jgi:O-antigen ligase
MLWAKKSRPIAMGVLLSAPWLIGAWIGPIGLIGAWVAAGVALPSLLFFHGSRFWSLSLILSATVSACFALVQYVGWAGQLSPWISDAKLGETLGNLRQRNQLATLLSIGLLSVLALRNSKRGAVYGLAPLVALLGVCNALSGSRTGLLQWVAVSSFAWLCPRSLEKTHNWLICVGAVGFAMGAIVASWLAEALGHANTGLLGRLDESNAFSRIALWSNLIELIAENPWLGHGWRSLAYVHYSTEFSGARFMELLDNAHNLPLHLAVELGVPVALAFCGGVGWLIWKNKPWAETRSDRQLAWGILMVIGIHSLVEYPLWYGPFFMTALICVGILCADVWRNWLFAQTGRAQCAIELGVKACACLLLAGTAFVAFDYHRVSQIYLQPQERSEWYKADALGAAQRSVFFQSHAKFAELQITPMTRENAPRILALSSELVRWSPEPRVIEKLIESATMMQQDDVAVFHLKRYKTAYPQAYAAWASGVQ